MARQKTATMQKVADSVGVSVSTVSRVLSNAEFASQQTRDIVIETAERLGYTRLRGRGASRPTGLWNNGSANRGAADTIVLLAPETTLDRLELSDWIYQDVVPTLQRLSKESGFHLVLSSYGCDDEWNPAQVTTKNIGGILWMASDREELLSQISKTVPVVVLNDNSHWPPQTSVMCSNRMVLFKALEHLAELGHRRVVFFGVDEGSMHCRERQNAYHEAVEHFKLDAEADLFILEKFGPGQHPQAVSHAMDQMENMESKPTGLVTSLTYAIQFLKEARKRSLSIPEDLSIVAIDNAPAAEWVDPSLTVVDCVFGRCTEIAVRLILEGRKSSGKNVRSVLVEPELIVRNSTTHPCTDLRG